VEAGLLDAAAETRIRAWEADRPGGPALRWPAWLALGLGVLLLGAGILLFVAAHWDGLGPGQRFALVVTVVGGLHLAAALASDRSPGLATALHACGTAALGGGIFLSGQIFHLREHWPGGLLLWAIGAAAGWALLRQWPQGAMAALLGPAWLAAEWAVATDRRPGGAVLGTFIVLTALAYLAAEPTDGRPTAIRRALVWLGGLALLPAAFTLVLLRSSSWHMVEPLPAGLAAVGWIVAVALPLGAGIALRRDNLAPLGLAAVWVVAGTFLASYRGVAPYLWCALLAAGVIAWGLRDRRAERINLGIAGFALTVLVFYFSDVMDKLGRSASLIGLGLLFLGGGYLLERTRRRLVSNVREDAP
jgi:uncharacterized membrane protein